MVGANCRYVAPVGGGQDTSGYMDVPAGDAQATSGYMDVQANAPQFDGDDGEDV